MQTNNTSIGQEIMRTQFSGNEKVREWKERYAKLFDDISQMAMDADKVSNETPAIHSPETISKHMELIRRNEEAIRCYAEASKILETSCMYLVKGITA